jgi:hypothetical protein
VKGTGEPGPRSTHWNVGSASPRQSTGRSSAVHDMWTVSKYLLVLGQAEQGFFVVRICHACPSPLTSTDLTLSNEMITSEPST